MLSDADLFPDAQPRDLPETVHSSPPLTQTQIEPSLERDASPAKNTEQNPKPTKSTAPDGGEDKGNDLGPAAQNLKPAASTGQDTDKTDTTAPATNVKPKAPPANLSKDPALQQTAAAQNPEPLSYKTIHKRMERIMQPNAKGNFKVGEDIRKQWQDIQGGGRDRLLQMFADCNHQPDRVLNFCSASRATCS